MAALARLPSALLLRSLGKNLALLGLEHCALSLPKTPARGSSLAVWCLVLVVSKVPLVWVQARWLLFLLLLQPLLRLSLGLPFELLVSRLPVRVVLVERVGSCPSPLPRCACRRSAWCARC